MLEVVKTHSKFLEARNYIDCNRLDEARQVLEENSMADVLCLYGLYVLVDMGFISDNQDKERIVKQFADEFANLESISNGNDLEVTFTLGVCYERGYIVDSDIRKAMNLYRRAYKQGHLRAGFNLAYCHQCKNKLPEIKKAILIYQALAKKDVVEAMTNLGVIYMFYKPLVDLELAKHYFQRAANAGDRIAAQHLQALESIPIKCVNCKQG